MKIVRLFVFILYLQCSLFSLSKSDVHSVMHEVLSLHVETKAVTAPVYRRMLKVFIRHFDPNKVYLLQSEVDAFVSLPISRIEEAVAQYAAQNYALLEELYATCVHAIRRHRAIRNAIAPEALLSGGSGDSAEYSSSYTALEERIRAFYQNAIEAEAGECAMSDVARLFSYVAQKQRSLEEKYSESCPEALHVAILKALTRALDAHSGYYTVEEAEKMRARLRRQFCGIGVVFTESYRGIFVEEILPGSSADRSGVLKVGDALIGVDTKQASKDGNKALLDALSGSEGSSVSVTLKRANDVVYSVSLVREKMVLHGARVRADAAPYADGVVGVIKVPSFYDNGCGVSSSEDMKRALIDLQSQGDLKGLVLDLRDNGGGFLSQAVKVAGLFIANGIVVISKYFDGEVRYSRALDGRCLFNGPMVVLTSKLSASAAEIVAQALQDHGVALVAGDSRTYGKGSMQYQTITDEKAKAFYKVTIGRYYTVSGKSTQIEGVRSDIAVPTKHAARSVGERFLLFPLSVDVLSDELLDSLDMASGFDRKQSPSRVVPSLEPVRSKWRLQLSRLKKNSAERLRNNANYQAFLRQVYNKTPIDMRKKHRKKDPIGQVDLQAQEGVEIIKDMHLLSLTSGHIQ